MNPRIAARWRRRLDDLEASLLPVSQWCELHGLCRNSVLYWQRKLAAERTEPAEAGNGRWLCVQEAQTPAVAALLGGQGVTLRIGSAILQVQPGFDPQLLRCVVAALSTEGGASCSTP